MKFSKILTTAALAAALVVTACSPSPPAGNEPYPTRQGTGAVEQRTTSGPVATTPPTPTAPAWQCTGEMKKIGTFQGVDSFAPDCVAGPIGRSTNLQNWGTVGSDPHVFADPAKPQQSFGLLRNRGAIAAPTVSAAQGQWVAGGIRHTMIGNGDAIAIQGYGKGSAWGPIKATFSRKVLFSYVVVIVGEYAELIGLVPKYGQPDGVDGCNNPTGIIIKAADLGKLSGASPNPGHAPQTPAPTPAPQPTVTPTPAPTPTAPPVTTAPAPAPTPAPAATPPAPTPTPAAPPPALTTPPKT